MQKIALTILEATERTGIGRSSLYKLFSTGKLTPRKLGKRTLILVEDLDSLVKSLPAGGPAITRQGSAAAADAVLPEIAKADGAVLDRCLPRPEPTDYSAAYLAQRYRLSPTMARLICCLAEIGGRLG